MNGGWGLGAVRGRGGPLPGGSCRPSQAGAGTGSFRRRGPQARPRRPRPGARVTAAALRPQQARQEQAPSPPGPQSSASKARKTRWQPRRAAGDPLQALGCPGRRRRGGPSGQGQASRTSPSVRTTHRRSGAQAFPGQAPAWGREGPGNRGTGSWVKGPARKPADKPSPATSGTTIIPANRSAPRPRNRPESRMRPSPKPFGTQGPA